jgi:hypothetical protein
MTAKTRAIPSLHRDSLAAKVPGSARCLRRVTQPPFIAGPLALTHKQILLSEIPAHSLTNNARGQVTKKVDRIIWKLKY